MVGKRSVVVRFDTMNEIAVIKPLCISLLGTRSDATGLGYDASQWISETLRRRGRVGLLQGHRAALVASDSLHHDEVCVLRAHGRGEFNLKRFLFLLVERLLNTVVTLCFRRRCGSMCGRVRGKSVVTVSSWWSPLWQATSPAFSAQWSAIQPTR